MITGNAAPGHTLMRVDKHTACSIVDRQTMMRAANNPYFIDAVQINKDTYELRLRKRSYSAHQPRQIGLMIYQLAKLQLLMFVYDLIDKYIDRSEYQVILCDTDSVYLGLSGPSLRACVRPELKTEFDREIRRWMPQYQCKTCWEERQQARDRGIDGDEDELEIKARCAGRDCCDQVRKRQRRTPGLWKVECESDAVIALSPKTYQCFNLEDVPEGEPDNNPYLPGKIFKGVKLSAKGVQKTNILTPEDYWRVYDSKRHRYIINRGIKRSYEREMKTYKQEKRGLTYLYTKRRVLRDGQSTRPLTL